jgi:hypothetical protein
MKNFLRALGRMAVIAVLFMVASIVYSTWRGYIRWYFRVDGQVLVNGQKTTGYLHANTDKTILLLTRTDDSRPETYLVSLGPTKSVFDCGEWHPLRFLPFPIGDLSHPCSAFTIDPAKVHDPPTLSLRRFHQRRCGPHGPCQRRPSHVGRCHYAARSSSRMYSTTDSLQPSMCVHLP